MTSEKAVVIGAGFGGIAAALRLRAKGYQVELIDRCSRLGGRAQVYNKEGFHFDAGPTVITAPYLFEELFTLFGKNLKDYLTLQPLDPWYRFNFSDGQYFDYGSSLESTLDEIKKFSIADQKNYLKLLKRSEEIFKIAYERLADKPFHKLSSMVKTIPDLVRLKSYQSVWSFICSYLENNHLRQAFSIQPLLVGGNPFDTTSIYALIHFLERKWGIYYAMGGTGAIVNALDKLMREEGIKITLTKTIEQVCIDKGVANGVVLNTGQMKKADIIVSNVDPSYLYRKMISKKYQPPLLKAKHVFMKQSMGLFVYYFGTKTTYPQVQHHTIILGQSYKKLLEDIFNRRCLSNDFSMYLHRPTATDLSMAPKGCDAFYVLVPVPNLSADIDWLIEGKLLRDRLISKLSERILPNLKQNLIVDFFKTPQDFATGYLSHLGSGFSIAPTLGQSAWFRYHNKAEGIKNLFLTGAGTHPGAGLPGVLSSAKVLEHLIPSIRPSSLSSAQERSVA